MVLFKIFEIDSGERERWTRPRRSAKQKSSKLYYKAVDDTGKPKVVATGENQL